MRILQLDHNQLERISCHPLNLLTFEETKSASVLEEGDSDKLDYLETLLLSFNKLRVIIRSNLMSLKKIEIASNHIQTIHEDAFKCTPLDNKLVLNENKIDKIPKPLDILDS